MEETREISALFHLIDDPDVEVFSTVSERIISMGTSIIPNLEHLWETTPDESVQERIELLIHRLHYCDLVQDFERWKKLPEPDLLAGALLVAKFQFPELDVSTILQDIEKMRRNIWLELNSYLTPLEQTNVLTTILYNYYHLKGTEISYTDPNDFLLNKVIETKKGNALSNGILYLVLCDLLDIPIRAVPIPRQFILAYFDIEPEQWMQLSGNNPMQLIQFYIDPMSGQVFSQKDIETYFRRISVPTTASFFKPMSNIRIIQMLVEELAKCFDDEKNAYKRDELLQLAGILGE
ncbi:transglutaminase-like domain-containing protein [Flavihumibacter profundi]|jgi:regulator of sirC expression with transglutaminase-like and TPR domain|uniref:transglutaminase-like domain-containing protein n=1 Tax=Flavihumibacter profundi TaxID=2716883 RepID=UPI001CC4C823|nr:transglutaminase-like domain-containing protein [Flavihumibacter profundi]MBZ5856254.1 transglutaminase-like domain-containing protein [Flavihumibacter profundi]